MDKYSLNSLAKVLGDFSDVHLDDWSSTDVETSFQIKPSEFLRFAEYDLENKYEHHLVNVLSNIKRAIDSQMDSLLIGFGLFEKPKHKKLAFPQKIFLLNSLGILSPRILEKVNRKRNLLEHEYIKPSDEDVEDARDIATLFIAYTNKFLFKALTQCTPFNDKTRESFMISLDYKKGKISVWNRGLKNDKVVKENLTEVMANSKDYIDYLKLFLSLNKLRI